MTSPRVIITDIEGTTSSIDFVHNVLFPYAKSHLHRYLEAHLLDPNVQSALNQVSATLKEEGNDNPDSLLAQMDALSHWMNEDRKHGALKKLQGLLWQEAYEGGSFLGHVYDDVSPNLLAWQEEGIILGVYSSGSVEAQKLLFGYSKFGDISHHFSYWFDTEVGPKREPDSYRNILKILKEPAHQVLFLSDIEAELDAAKVAGMATICLQREGNEGTIKHSMAKDFHAVTKLIHDST